MTGGFAYAPCQAFSTLNLQCPRREGQSKKISPKAVAKAISSITLAQNRLRAEAVANLVTGTDRGIAQAIQRLETAARDGNDAKILNDLAVAYVERACHDQDPYDLMRALTTIERAVATAPRLPEALFNRALILERLHLKRQASEAWTRYRDIDPDSNWSLEAIHHARKLSTPPASDVDMRPALEKAAAQGDGKAIAHLATSFPQAARELAMNKLLADWGENWKAGRIPSAERALNTAREIGAALRKISGDEMVADTVSVIDRSAASPPSVTKLARAQVAYGAATKYFNGLAVEAAGVQFREARGEFSSSGSPMVMWADCGLAGVELSRHHYRAALEAFGGLVDRVERRRYPALYGRISWGMGLVRGRQGKLTEALAHYQDAGKSFRQAHETSNELTMESMSAEGLKLLGQDASAWTYRYRALTGLSDLPVGRQLHNLLWEAADNLRRSGQAASAQTFQEEDVKVAREYRDPFMIAEALHRRATILASLGRQDEALRDIAEARTVNAQGTSEVTRMTTAADIDRTEGEIQLPSDPRTAATLLTRAVESFHRAGRPTEEVICRLSRARANLQLDRRSVLDLHLRSRLEREAEGDLDTSLAWIENERAAISDLSLRESFSEAAQSFFDELILLQADVYRDPRRALVMAERARRVPGEGVGTMATEAGFEKDGSFNLSKIPANVAVIEYALSGDRLLIWMLWPGGMKFVDRRISPQELAARVENFTAAVRGGSDQSIADTSAQIYNALIPPWVEALPDSVQLVFVPDRYLNGVPFAALRNPRTGRYLVEEHASSVVPSLQLYLACLSRGTTRDRQHWSALLVSNPAFDKSVFQFPDLPGASAEVEKVEKLYADRLTISGHEATPSRLLAEMDRHEVFAFAGHAVFNARDPKDSYLVTAPEPSNGGAILARDIAKLQFHRLKLVILSACHTSASTSRRIGGLSGLAKPFLEGGAAAVLATLWSIDDVGAGRFSGEFQQNFIKTMPPVLALRSAQLSALHNAHSSIRSPNHWASFQVVGELR
ncbi:MAG: CHAT domain-containing protein [Thermoanaerobaculia bacterium]